jgi:MarR-like DNA-binding transcriptional regulator SgrR of sgrS sRNA
MRLTASRSIALISCAIAVAALEAARRPHYGGTLRIEMHAAVANLDPAGKPADSAEADAKEKLTGQVFENLIRIGENGEPQPHLALSWTHDAAHKRWLFAARPRVLLHNGIAWDPPGGTVAVDDRKPIEEILRNLAKPESAVVVHAPDGSLLGTGPFRIAKWDAKKSLTLEAHDGYWRGRPYLDAIDVQLGRAQRDQALDFELAKTDVIELPLSEVRRTQQRGGKVVASAPVETLALVIDSGKPDPDRLREALALSIDRAAIHNVLLQRQGEIAGALLPQWLTGYAVLFPTERNLPRAKELAAGVQPLAFAYDRQTPLLRSIAERIALNAGEAGIVLRPVSGGAADVRLVELRITSLDAGYALADLASALQSPLAMTPAANPSNLYELERALIGSRRVIPLFHLPAAYQLGANVHGLATPMADQWRLADVWLDERAKP